MVKMPAAIWRTERIAVAQMLLSGRGEWGQTGILKRKSRDKEGGRNAAGKASGSGSKCSRVHTIITTLKNKAESRVHVARHCIPVPVAMQPPLALPSVSSPLPSRREAHGNKVLVHVSKPCQTQHGTGVPQLRSRAGAQQEAALRSS